MRLSTWGIHKKFLSLTQQEKACLYVRELGWAFRFYFLVVHLYLFTSPKVLLTNPVKQSVLCTESRSFHPYSKQFLPLTQAPDELGFLPLCCIRITMKWSPGRSSAVTTLLALMRVLLYSFNGPCTAFISLNHRHTPGWQFRKDLWNEDPLISLKTVLSTMYLPLTMVDWPGILTQGELESDLGDSFEIQIPLSISHLPTHVHKCMELLFTNASVWGTTLPVWLFYPSLLVIFIFRSGIWPLPSASCQSSSVKRTMQSKNGISTFPLSWGSGPEAEKGPDKYILWITIYSPNIQWC